MPERIRSGEREIERVAHRGDSAIPASGPDSVAPIVRERRLLRVMQSMESHLPHSVRELAQQVHLSPAHLQRLFKQETGVHIGELLTERRLTTAANLLTSTEMGVKEIAYLVGYGHHSSFVRAFQRRYGQPPKRYRRACA
jgi:transcriptional regulator GlxA family with amidase domain